MEFLINSQLLQRVFITTLFVVVVVMTPGE